MAPASAVQRGQQAAPGLQQQARRHLAPVGVGSLARASDQQLAGRPLVDSAPEGITRPASRRPSMRWLTVERDNPVRAAISVFVNTFPERSRSRICSVPVVASGWGVPTWELIDIFLRHFLACRPS